MGGRTYKPACQEQMPLGSAVFQETQRHTDPIHKFRSTWGNSLASHGVLEEQRAQSYLGPPSSLSCATGSLFFLPFSRWVLGETWDICAFLKQLLDVCFFLHLRGGRGGEGSMLTANYDRLVSQATTCRPPSLAVEKGLVCAEHINVKAVYLPFQSLCFKGDEQISGAIASACPPVTILAGQMKSCLHGLFRGLELGCQMRARHCNCTRL